MEICEDDEIVILEFAKTLPIGVGVLSIFFQGTLNDRMKGFYRRYINYFFLSLVFQFLCVLFLCVSPSAVFSLMVCSVFLLYLSVLDVLEWGNACKENLLFEFFFFSKFGLTHNLASSGMGYYYRSLSLSSVIFEVSLMLGVVALLFFVCFACYGMEECL